MAWKIVYIISPFVNSIVRAIRLTRFKFIHLYLILSWSDFIIHYEVYAEIYSFFFLHYIPNVSQWLILFSILGQLTRKKFALAIPVPFRHIVDINGVFLTPSSPSKVFSRQEAKKTRRMGVAIGVGGRDPDDLCRDDFFEGWIRRWRRN